MKETPAVLPSPAAARCQMAYTGVADAHCLGLCSIQEFLECIVWRIRLAVTALKALLTIMIG
jgi:hypothetical protein